MWRLLSVLAFGLLALCALPLTAGPFKVVPYVKGVAADYTHDLNGDETGRLWGGGGVRASARGTSERPSGLPEGKEVSVRQTPGRA